MMTSSTSAERPSEAWFGTTHWSVVLTAGRSDTPRAQAALERLCSVYWRPLYAYVRRRGHSPEDAEDLTQEFFYRLLERQALARLNHPNIVTVYDFGQTEDFCYLLMEFVDGASLRQLLRAGKLAPEQALAIVPRICEALQFAHDKGIVHRDIKPENVLLDKEGRVKIADFGIAKIVCLEAGQRSLTQAQQVIGTPHYMAPEQIETPGRVDHRADIYSLGVVFYEMLTGELPLGKFAPPSRKVQVDVRLDEVVLHALEKEPDRRYQHASEVKTDVEDIGLSAAQGTRREIAYGPLAAHPWLVLLVGLPFLAGIAFGIRLDQPLLGAAGWAGWIGCLVVFFTLRKQGPQSVAAKSVAEPGKRKAEQDAAGGFARSASAADATESSPDRSASRVPSPKAPVRAGREQQPFINTLFLLFFGFFWTMVGLEKALPGIAAVGCVIVLAGVVWALQDAIKVWLGHWRRDQRGGLSVPVSRASRDPIPRKRDGSLLGYRVVATLVMIECGFVAAWVLTDASSWLGLSAISSAVWGVVSHIGIVVALRNRGFPVKYPLFVPLMPIQYLPQYQAMTLKESGRIGSLSYSYDVRPLPLGPGQRPPSSRLAQHQSPVPSNVRILSRSAGSARDPEGSNRVPKAGAPPVDDAPAR